MKKLIALALVLIMMVSGNAFADALSATTDVNGTTFSAGTQGTVQNGLYTYNEAVTVNGISYPAGTQFQVMQVVTGQMVPIATAAGGVLPIASGFTFAVAGTGLAVGTTGIVVGGALLGAAAFSSSNKTTNTTP